MKEGTYNIIGEGRKRIIERQEYPRLSVTVDLSGDTPEIKSIQLIDYDGPEEMANSLREVDLIISELNMSEVR
jgi:hypothetical protein